MINKTKILDVNTFNPFLAPKSIDSLQISSLSGQNFKVNKQNFKEYTKNCLKNSFQKKSVTKKHLGFSPLENQKNSLTKSCLQFESSHDYKSPRSCQSSFQYSQYNNILTNSILPGFFIDEREAFINCKENIHERIIEIGENVHESVIKEVTSNLEATYRQRESELMKKMEKEKEMQLENERAQFMVKLEEIKCQLKTEYDLKLKEKVTETRINCQNSAQEDLENYKLDIRKNMEEKISEIKQHYNNERKQLAEKSARKERERLRHQMDLERLANERKIEELNELWEKKVQDSAEELSKKLRFQFDQELKLKIKELNQTKETELLEQKQNYDFYIEKIKQEINTKEIEIKNLNSKLKILENKNEQIINELEKTKAEFRNCIKRFTRLNFKESEFLFAFNEFNFSD